VNSWERHPQISPCTIFLTGLSGRKRKEIVLSGYAVCLTKLRRFNKAIKLAVWPQD